MIRSSTVTKQGGRELNEDKVLEVSKENRNLFVIADGLGGHGRGEVASAFVAEALKNEFEANSRQENCPMDQWVSDVIERAQNQLMEEQKRLHACDEMKTTVVVLYMEKDQLCWGHVGDSRLYGFSGHKIRAQTLDHSIPQMLAISGDIPKHKIRNHPQRNMLLRVVGIPWERQMQAVSEIQNKTDYQAFLMCTDGFWELILEREMSWLLRFSRTPEEWLEKMTRIVEKRGKNKDMDNYSAIAVFVD